MQRAAVLIALTALACGEARGESEPCVTSAGCAGGEHCDDGMCVARAGCPPAMAPKLVFEETSYRFDWFGGLITLGGEEYLHGETQTGDHPKARTLLVHVASGTQTTIDGWLHCFDTQCVRTLPGSQVELWDGMHTKSGAPVAEQVLGPLHVPGDRFIVRHLHDDRLTYVTDEEVRRLDFHTGDIESIYPLTDAWLLEIISDERGRATHLVLRDGPMREVAVYDLDTGERRVVAPSHAIVYPGTEDYLAIEYEPSTFTGGPNTIWRSRPGQPPQLLGTSNEVSLRRLFLDRTAREWIPGEGAYALECPYAFESSDEACDVVRWTFTSSEAEMHVVGSVGVTGTANARLSKRLACDAFEIVQRTVPDSHADPGRFYVSRFTPP